MLLDRLNKLKELGIFLKSLSAYKGLYVYVTTIADEVKAVKIAEETILDMDDAIQYSSALSKYSRALFTSLSRLIIPRFTSTRRTDKTSDPTTTTNTAKTGTTRKEVWQAGVVLK